MGPEINKR